MKENLKILKGAFYGVLGVLVLAIVFRLVLDPIATHYTRRALREMPNFTGDFDHLHISLFPLGYNIYGLSIRESPVKESAKPLLEIEALEARLIFTDLLRATLGASADLTGVKVVWTITKSLEDEISEKIRAVKKYVPINNLDELDDFLLKQPPFRFARLQIKDAQLDVYDARERTKPRIRLHKIESVVENFANRERLDGDRPSLISMHGTLQETGQLTTSMRIVPLDPKLNVVGQAALQDLPLSEVYGLLAAKTDLQVPEGRFDIFAALKTQNGIISGGVKPILRNVKITAAKDSPTAKIMAVAVQATAKLFANEEGGEDIIGTTIPIGGTVASPKGQFVPTLLGILRNAFVEPLPDGYADVPPKKAPEKQSLITQIVKAFSKDEGPPKAQPEDNIDVKQQLLASSEKITLSEHSAEQIRTELEKRGYEPSSTGKIDARTQRALAKFQEDEGLAATGFPDTLTLKRLRLNPERVLKKKSEREQREVAQQETSP
jgi:hypothetical protein